MRVVNIFLGGSGKYVAEELKGTKSYYNVDLPGSIAFDVDASATHSGIFNLNEELSTVDSTFPDYAKDTVAEAWYKIDAGAGIEPAPASAGPITRPEKAVMRRIGRDTRELKDPGDGLWGVRAPGLLAFDAFLAPDSTGTTARQRANRFRERLETVLVMANQGGAEVRVNIFASTAGGTGAGTFLPFALFIRQTLPNIPKKISLVLIVSSAFDREPVDRGRNLLEMQTKGRSGTFAILRELQLLHKADPQMRLPEREFPLASGPLRYQLGGKVFDSVYWIGRRQTDEDARKFVAYEEASRVAQALSNDQVVDLLAAGAAAQYSQRLLPSAVTADYPKLRIARRLSSRLVEAVLKRLKGSPSDTPANVALADYGGATPDLLGSFIAKEKDRALHKSVGGDGTVPVASMDSLIEPFTHDEVRGKLGFRNVQTGAARVQGGYAAGETAWNSYGHGLASDLDAERDKNKSNVAQRIVVKVSEEAVQFTNWLNRGVIDSLLNPQEEQADGAADGTARTAVVAQAPASVRTVRLTMDAIERELTAVKSFFSAKQGVKQRVPNNTHTRFQTAAEIENKIQTQQNLLFNPARQKGRGLSFVQWLLLLVGAAAVWFVAWLALGALTDGIVRLSLSVVAGAAFGFVLHRWLAGRERSLPELRRDAERKLFGLYDDLLYAQTGHEVFAAVQEYFVPAAEAAIAAGRERLAELEKVYDALLDRATARLKILEGEPKHSVDQVAVTAQVPQARQIEMQQRLLHLVRVPAVYGVNLNDLRLRVVGIPPAQPAQASVKAMADAAGEDEGASTGQTQGGMELDAMDTALDDMATSMLGDYLPADLAAAIEAEVGATPAAQTQRVANMLQRLMHLLQNGIPAPGVDRRQPSVDAAGMGAATVRYILVPNQTIAGLVTAAVDPEGRYLNDSVRTEVTQYLIRDEQSYKPLIVPQIGQSIMALSIWVPNPETIWAGDQIGGTPEGSRAMRTFYGLVLEAKEDAFQCQRTRNFHILPELAAASAIELGSNIIRPLHPVVISRLLGSDPDVAGPTMIELFYLLRSRGYLTWQTVVDEKTARQDRVYELKLHDRAPIPLLSHPQMQVPEPGDPFGASRWIINWFDAFHDFLLYDGHPLAYKPDGTLDDSRFVQIVGNTTLQVESWARLGRVSLGDAQRAIVQEWRRVGLKGQIDVECEGMRKQAEDDANAMGGGLVSQDWIRMTEYVIRTGCEKRRQYVAHPEQIAKTPTTSA